VSGTALAGRIGPNAVIRLAEALDALESKAVTVRLFEGAGLGPYVLNPPDSMIPERDVTALHHRLRADLGITRASTVSWIAGLRTADYLLANRIPKPVQRLLRILPRRIAAFILLKAIGAHAWTFAGTARFNWSIGRNITLIFENCALCRGEHATAPCCAYYASTFERLFRELISADTRVLETACVAMGDSACRFDVRL
jgi:divinyl protochlorophyllide a 8-vinyl-reductase